MHWRVGVDQNAQDSGQIACLSHYPIIGVEGKTTAYRVTGKIWVRSLAAVQARSAMHWRGRSMNLGGKNFSVRAEPHETETVIAATTAVIESNARSRLAVRPGVISG